MKMAPLARPRRAAGMCASTVGAARTIRAPPERPEAKRQAKNHAKLTGHAQAKNAAVANSIIARRTAEAEARAAIGAASNAPARYPARLAAPR